MSQLKSFSIYAISTFLNAAISFLTFSLLTHHLNEVDYGIINLYNGFIIFLAPFISVGVQFTLSVDYFKMDAATYRNHFTTSMVIPLAAFFIVTLLCIAFGGIIESFIQVGWLYVLIIPVLCFITTLNDIALNLIRNKGSHYLFAGFSVVKNVVEIGLTILFIIGLNHHWQGRLNSNIITLAISLVVILFLFNKWKLLSGSYDKKDVKKVFFLSLPFVPERLAIFVLGYSDRFFINYYNGTDDVGFYSAGAQIALIVNLVILTLINTFHPLLFRKLSEQDVNYSAIKKICYSYLGISIVICLLLIIVTPLIFDIFIGPDFQAGQVYAFNLIIGSFFWALYNLFLSFLLNHKRNKLIMVISIFAMALSLALNFFLVKNFGALGATYTNILVYFSMAVFALFFVHKSYRLKFFLKPSI